MTREKTLGCVLLAAGSARRYGENKLLTALDGRSLILRAMEAVPAELMERVVVVTAYPEIMRLAAEFHFAALFNDAPALGASHTIALGLTQLRDLDGVMFLVCDQPLLRRGCGAGHRTRSRLWATAVSGATPVCSLPRCTRSSWR